MQRRYKTGWSRLVSTSSQSESNWLLLKEEWEVKRKESSQSWFCLQTKRNNKWVVPLTQYHSDLYHFLSFHSNDTFLSKNTILYEWVSHVVGWQHFLMLIVLGQLNFTLHRALQRRVNSETSRWRGAKQAKVVAVKRKCLKSWVELRWASFVTQLESLFLM